MTKKNYIELVGVLMFIAGVVLLFANIRVGGSFFGMRGAGILFLLMGIDFVALIVKPNKIFGIIMALLVVALIVMVIIKMRIYLIPMSMFKWIGIALLIFGGTGLIIKGRSKD